MTAGGQSVGRSVGRVNGLALAVLICGGNVVAQSRPPDRATVRPTGSELTVYLMTMGPGKQVWERFGHNAIWIHDPVAGTDQTYNYGLFDFGQEGFLLRFIQGRMWYWMRGFPAQSYVESYRRDNRSVWVQELEIAPQARRELQQFLLWNERPENRYYHYDYYQDNCSTRVRDALDQALGGLIRAQTSGVPAGTTYRFHTQRLTANDRPIFTGLLLGLGQPVDRPISQWEEMFLPLSLREHLRNLTVKLEDGRTAPLVKSERTLFESTGPTPPAQPPDWTLGYLLIGVVTGGGLFGLACLGRRHPWARYGFLASAWTWLVVSGVAGVVVAGLWGATNHSAAYRNENVLQADLLALPLLWFLTRLVMGSARTGRAALVLGVVIATLSLLGLLLKVFPGFDQVNGPIIALALPSHLGLAAGIWSLNRS